MSNKNISVFIKEQFPKYILESSSVFPEFLEAYYEWANQSGNFQDTLYDVAEINNVDLSYTRFMEDFIKEYLQDIPRDIVADKPLLIKKIHELYQAKGTPKAVEFLIKILHNIDSEVFYPSTQIFKASDAKWNRDVSVRFTISSGDITNFSQSYATINYGNRVVDVIILKIVEDSEIDGLYEAFLDIKYKLYIDPNSTATLVTDEFVGNLVKTTTTKSILSRGKYFLVGDIYSISGASGDGTRIKVTKVDQKSGLSGFQIIQFGNGFTNSFTSTIEPTSNAILSEIDNVSDISAEVQFTLGYVLEYPGYYSTNTGFLSDASYLHDGEYYQQFSYVVKTEVEEDEYIDGMPLVHPSGLKAFSEYIIENSIDINVEISTLLNKINSKIIDTIGFSDESYIITQKEADEESISMDDSISVDFSMGEIEDSISFVDELIFGFLIEQILSDNLSLSDEINSVEVNKVADIDNVVVVDQNYFDMDKQLDIDNMTFIDSNYSISFNKANIDETITLGDVITLGSNQLSASVYTHTATSINLTSIGTSGWHKPTTSDLNGGSRMTGGRSVTVTEYDPSSIVVSDTENKAITFTASNPSLSSVIATRLYKNGSSPNEYGFYLTIPIDVITRRIRVYVMAYRFDANNVFKFYTNLQNGAASPVTIFPTISNLNTDNYFVLDVTASSTSNTNLYIWWTCYNNSSSSAQSAMHYQGVAIGN